MEKSIRKGRLEKLEDHIAGSYTRNTRPVGDLTITTKGGRTPFTAADDQFLWDYVKPVEETGGSVKGNEIYKQIAAANPRHTFQSWRDRWIRHVSMHKMQSSNHREPTQPKASSPPKATGAGAAPAETASAPMRWQDVPQQRLDSFTKPDFTMLLKGASDIANMEPRNAPKAWAQFAKEASDCFLDCNSRLDLIDCSGQLILRQNGRHSGKRLSSPSLKNKKNGANSRLNAKRTA